MSIRVTDHAIVRYLQRAKGFDIEAVRQHIVELCEAPHAAGANCVKVEGVKFELHKGVVVTCTPGNGGFSNTKRVKIALRAKFAAVHQGAG